MRHGTRVADRVRMAAVLCLVFLPLMMASVAFASASPAAAAVTFLLLGTLVLVMSFQMSRLWDEERS